MGAPNRSTLKQALAMGSSVRSEDRLHKLVGHPDCDTCSTTMKPEFLKQAAAEWHTLAKLAGGKGR
jgi:hypothetical protein